MKCNSSNFERVHPAFWGQEFYKFILCLKIKTTERQSKNYECNHWNTY